MRRGEYRQAAGIRRAQRRNCESNYAAFSHSLCFSFLRQLAQQPHRQPNRVGDALNLRCSFATRSFDFYYPVFNRIGSVNSAAVKSSRNFYPVSPVSRLRRHNAHPAHTHGEKNQNSRSENANPRLTTTAAIKTLSTAYSAMVIA